MGDRLLKVDSHSLTGKTLMEAQQLLRENTSKSNQQHGLSISTLTIEYDVSVMDSVKYANGPLLVEIDRYCLTNKKSIVQNIFGLLKVR